MRTLNAKIDDPNKLWARIEKLKSKLGCHATAGMARRWWNNFESERVEEPRTVLSILQQLEKRGCPIKELFSAALYSQTETMEGNLEFVDFTRQRCGRNNLTEKDFEAAGKSFLC